MRFIQMLNPTVYFSHRLIHLFARAKDAHLNLVNQSGGLTCLLYGCQLAAAVHNWATKLAKMRVFRRNWRLINVLVRM